MTSLNGPPGRGVQAIDINDFIGDRFRQSSSLSQPEPETISQPEHADSDYRKALPSSIQYSPFAPLTGLFRRAINVFKRGRISRSSDTSFGKVRECSFCHFGHFGLRIDAQLLPVFTCQTVVCEHLKSVGYEVLCAHQMM